MDFSFANDFLTSLLINIPFPLFIKDSKGVYFFVNEFAAQSLGLETKDLLGKTDADLFKEYPDLKELYSSNDVQVLNNHEVLRKVYRIPNFKTKELNYFDVVKFDLNGDHLVVIGLDITEVTKLNSKLSLFKTVIDSMTEGVLICTNRKQGSVISYCNSFFEKLSLYNFKDIVGKPLSFLFKLKTDIFNEKIIEGIKKDGTTFIAQINSFKVEEKYLVSVIKDITTEYLNKRNLALSNNLYSTIVESQVDLICRLDLTGKIVFTNKAFDSFFGEGWLDKYYVDLLYEKDRSHWQDNFKLLLSNKAHTISRQNRCYDLNKEVKWLDWRDCSVKDIGDSEDDEIDEILCVGRDISQSRTLESKVQCLLDSYKNPTFLLDAFGVVQDCNKAAFILSSYEDKEEFLRCNLWNTNWFDFSNENSLAVKEAISSLYAGSSRISKDLKVFFIKDNNSEILECKVDFYGFRSWNEGKLLYIVVECSCSKNSTTTESPVINVEVDWEVEKFRKDLDYLLTTVSSGPPDKNLVDVVRSLKFEVENLVSKEKKRDEKIDEIEESYKATRDLIDFFWKIVKRVSNLPWKWILAISLLFYSADGYKVIIKFFTAPEVFIEKLLETDKLPEAPKE